MPPSFEMLSQWTTDGLLNSASSNSWTTHNPANWVFSPATTASIQNGQHLPSVLCSQDAAVGNQFEGTFRTRDDDYIGFALDFTPGDFTNSAAEYYIIDWKQRGQVNGNGFNPCGDASVVSDRGLSAIKVEGVATEGELFGHDDFTCAEAPATVTELARGSSLGDVGYETDAEYDFLVEVCATGFKVFIKRSTETEFGPAEIEYLATMDKAAPFCLYSFSQQVPFFKDVTVQPSSTAGCDGDPHFKTWTNEHFEYHGQCDLVLAKDAGFADGLGLDVHIRTKMVRYWSYIKSAVIRIGNDVLEIEGSSTDFDSETHYWLNYEFQAELTEFAGFPVKIFAQEGTKVHKNRIEIDLSSKYPGQKIVLSTFKEFVKVQFENASEKSFGNTVGMLGNFQTGKTVGRDGVTEINDFTDYGHEWQVLPADGKLFRHASHPQFPELCLDPEDPRGQRTRRLAESSVSIEDAEAACASLKDELDRKDCVYDIIATQDMDMVGAY